MWKHRSLRKENFFLAFSEFKGYLIWILILYNQQWVMTLTIFFSPTLFSPKREIPGVKIMHASCRKRKLKTNQKLWLVWAKLVNWECTYPQKSSRWRHMTSHLGTDATHAPAWSRRAWGKSREFVPFEMGGREGEQRNPVAHIKTPTLNSLGPTVLYWGVCLDFLPSYFTLPS